MAVSGITGLVAVFGSGAASVISTGRNINIDIVGDETAMFALTPETKVEAEAGETVDLINIVNFVGSQVLIDIQILEAGQLDIKQENLQYPTKLNYLESGTIAAAFECNEPTEDTISLEITARGDGVSAKLTRSIPVACTVSSFDPFDYEEVWEYGDDHSSVSGTKLSLDTDSVPGGVSLNGPEKIDVAMEGGSTIAGFVRIKADDGVNMTIYGDSQISKTVVINACGRVDVELKEGSIIVGDMYIGSAEDVSVVVTDNAVIQGDLVIASGAPPNVDTMDGGKIEGTVDTDSDWNPPIC